MVNIPDKMRREFKQQIREAISLRDQFMAVLEKLDDTVYMNALLVDTSLAFRVFRLATSGQDVSTVEKPGLMDLILDSEVMHTIGVVSDEQLDALLAELMQVALQGLQAVADANREA